MFSCLGAFNHFMSNCRIMHCLKLRNTLHVGHGMTQIRVNADSVTRCMWNIIGNHMDEKMSPFLEYLFSLHLLLLCIVCHTFLRVLVMRIWCEIKQWKLCCSGKVGKGEGEMCDSCWCSSQMLEISHLIVNMYLTLTCSCTVNDL